MDTIVHFCKSCLAPNHPSPTHLHNIQPNVTFHWSINVCVCVQYLMWKLSPYGSTENAAHKDLLAQMSTILQCTQDDRILWHTHYKSHTCNLSVYLVHQWEQAQHLWHHGTTVFLNTGKLSLTQAYTRKHEHGQNTCIISPRVAFLSQSLTQT